MKKGLFLLLLCLLMCIPSAHGTITWTKDWSSADDGDPYSGSDIQDMQSDISSQAATSAGDNTFSGSNTFSGATTFTGTVTGIAAAKDAITRGFELQWGSKEQVIVRVGTLYHGTTQVDKTSNVHLDVTTASDYVTGVSQQGTSKWLYVYIGSTGTVKLDATAPNRSDTSNDTEGTSIYYLTGSTYYRCVGAIRLNATGSGEVTDFYPLSRVAYMWNTPISVTTTLSTAAWSGATSCSAGMPAISTQGIFGIKGTRSSNPVNVWIRPQGSTWSTDSENGVISSNATGLMEAASQRVSATDSSQQIQYYDNNGGGTVAIDVEGYVVDIR